MSLAWVYDAAQCHSSGTPRLRVSSWKNHLVSRRQHWSIWNPRRHPSVNPRCSRASPFAVVSLVGEGVDTGVSQGYPLYARHSIITHSTFVPSDSYGHRAVQGLFSAVCHGRQTLKRRRLIGTFSCQCVGGASVSNLTSSQCRRFPTSATNCSLASTGPRHATRNDPRRWGGAA